MEGATDMAQQVPHSWTRTCTCCWSDACQLLPHGSVILRERGGGSWKERVHEERGRGSVQTIVDIYRVQGNLWLIIIHCP